MIRTNIIFTLFSIIVVANIFCNDIFKRDDNDQYLNLNDSVKYVGIQSCISCHKDVYETFIHTGMGQSFEVASPEKSAAIFGEQALIYDKHKDFYYKPFWKDDSMMIMEFRLDGKDTVHKRIEHVSYIIGSGQHTNSHIINIEGYLYQAPITYYTQRGVWDFAPGFEGIYNSRFSRPIGLECMTCHNGLPEYVKGSVNKYSDIKVGIDCERCHGPGELHVKATLAGDIVDTTKHIDYTIIKPTDLPLSLQISICQRCHLQGIAILQPNKSFEDFRPGMQLSDILNTFLPRHEGKEDKFIMASHMERLTMSQCYIRSKKLSCTNCHMPHKSVTIVNKGVYNNVCRECHGNDQCSVLEELRLDKKNNCIECHMPKSGSIDIPHIAVTDHYIRKPFTVNIEKKERRYLGLVCLTDNNPEPKTVIKAYLALYEKFGSGRYALDSAAHYLSKHMKKGNVKMYYEEVIHYLFLKKDFDALIAFITENNIDMVKDAWTYYRIGEAFHLNERYETALKYFKKAVEANPYNLDFQNKLGTTYMQLQDIDRAKKIFEYIINENPKHVAALSNIGFIYLNLNKPDKAAYFYDRALSLDPDYEAAIFNKIGLHIYRKEYNIAMEILREMIRKDPENKKAQIIMKQLSEIN